MSTQQKIYFCTILHSWSKRLSPWKQHVKTNAMYWNMAFKIKFWDCPALSSHSFWVSKVSKQRPRKPFEIMTTEMDILPTTRDKCCDTINFSHWLSFPNWLLWNLWQLYQKKMWQSVSTHLWSGWQAVAVYSTACVFISIVCVCRKISKIYLWHGM